MWKLFKVKMWMNYEVHMNKLKSLCKDGSTFETRSLRKNVKCGFGGKIKREIC